MHVDVANVKFKKDSKNTLTQAQVDPFLFYFVLFTSWLFLLFVSWPFHSAESTELYILADFGY